MLKRLVPEETIRSEAIVTENVRLCETQVLDVDCKGRVRLCMNLDVLDLQVTSLSCDTVNPGLLRLVVAEPQIA